jgi:cystinosin
MMDVFFNHEARVRREKRSNSEAAIKKEAEEQQDCIFYKIFSCSPLLFFSRGGRDFNQTIHKITKPQNLHTYLLQFKFIPNFNSKGTYILVRLKHITLKSMRLTIDSEVAAACTPLLTRHKEQTKTTSTITGEVALLEENRSSSNPRTTKKSRPHKTQECDEAVTLQIIHTPNYHKFFHPFMDTSGNTTSILKGLSYLTLLGAVVGILMPKNNDLPTPSYRYLSSIMGYSYFIFWCSSFYPQILSNYERKSTEGLSVDFSISNFVGYICYAIYTSLLYWNKNIQHLYQERHHFSIEDADVDGDGIERSSDAKITVQSNDVAFALHAVLFSAIWIYQLYIYGGLKWRRGEFPISRIFVVFICLIISSISLYAYLIAKAARTFKNPWMASWAMAHLNWLDFIYFLSFVKVSITLSKYIPQVALNAR